MVWSLKVVLLRARKLMIQDWTQRDNLCLENCWLVTEGVCLTAVLSDGQVGQRVLLLLSAGWGKRFTVIMIKREQGEAQRSWFISTTHWHRCRKLSNTITRLKSINCESPKCMNNIHTVFEQESNLILSFNISHELFVVWSLCFCKNAF